MMVRQPCQGPIPPGLAQYKVKRRI